MKIICINNSDLVYEPNGLEYELLTINKTYEVVRANKGQYYIKDNSGDERWYCDSRFKYISIIRKEKLKQLGI